MNKAEQYVKKKYEKLGYIVLRNGWPDFLVMKGPIGFCVEVKSSTDKLSVVQIKTINYLSKAGIETRVEITDRTLNGTRENFIRHEYENKGFTVLRNGWPDFLLVDGFGLIKGLEVKVPGYEGELSNEQMLMHSALSVLWMPVEIEILPDVYAHKTQFLRSPRNSIREYYYREYGDANYGKPGYQWEKRLIGKATYSSKLSRLYEGEEDYYEYDKRGFGPDY